MHTVIVWLKRIFTIQTIGLMVAVGSLLVAIHQVLSDSSGEPVVCWNDSELEQGSTIRTYIYTSSTEQIPIAPLLAKIDNPSQHTTHDVSAKYQVQPQGVELSYSLDYRAQEGLQGVELRNIDSALPAFEQMSAPVNYAELKGDKGRIELSLRLTYNGIETPFKANQQIIIKRFKASALRTEAIADARKQTMGELSAIYLYSPASGFLPFNTWVENSGGTQTKPKYDYQSDVTTKKQEPAKEVTKKVDKKPSAKVGKSSSVKQNKKGPHWVLVVGLILLCSALFFLAFILAEPSEAAYNIIWEQICDGFKINFSAVKRTFDNGFDTETIPFYDKMFGSHRTPAFIRGIIYAICWVIFVVMGFFWILTLLAIPLGVLIAIKEFF